MTTWEERFDKFAENLCIGFIDIDEGDGYTDEDNIYLSEIEMGYNELKAFIASELQRQREELVGMLKPYQGLAVIDDIIKKIGQVCQKK